METLCTCIMHIGGADKDDVICSPDGVIGLSDDVIAFSVSNAALGMSGLFFIVVPCWLLTVACSAVLQEWKSIQVLITIKNSEALATYSDQLSLSHTAQ